MDNTLRQLLEALVNTEFENQRLRQELENAAKSRQEFERRMTEAKTQDSKPQTSGSRD